ALEFFGEAVNDVEGDAFRLSDRVEPLRTGDVVNIEEDPAVRGLRDCCWSAVGAWVQQPADVPCRLSEFWSQGSVDNCLALVEAVEDAGQLAKVRYRYCVGVEGLDALIGDARGRRTTRLPDPLFCQRLTGAAGQDGDEIRSCAGVFGDLFTPNPLK